MVKILTYDDQTIEVLQKTFSQKGLILKACYLNSGKTVKDDTNLIRFLIKAGHTGPFEHIIYTFNINNISRSFLAQITRHRIGTFSSTSQHYQDYRDYPFIISPNTTTLRRHAFELSFNKAMSTYQFMIKMGEPKEEARQVLPNAMGVNLLWTVNARSLMNFFTQRLCRRNILEMTTFADNLYKIVYPDFPELWRNVGPACKFGPCNQGTMKCEEAYRVYP